MAYMSMARRILSLVLVTLSLADALRVSPDSPCTSVCANSNVSQSDPNFSDEQWKDIVCSDKDLDSKPEGQRLKSCFTCLQNSTYAHGGENDQDWFLYNLRYSSSYCMFGYPNSTGFDSGPCTTTVGCGSLAPALELDIKKPTNSTPYGYCDANGGAITSNAVEGCLQCVKADGEHDYLSNFLLTLQGACRTKSAPGSLLVLNNTIFGNDTIQVVDPVSATNYEGPKLSSSAIVGIIVAAIVILALAAGFTFVCIRKRKARAREQNRASGYSFRCQTRVTPVTPKFPDDIHADDRLHGEKKAHAVVPTVVASGADSYQEHRYPWNSQSSLSVTISRQDSAVMRPSVITTALPPPNPAHISPRAFSPDDYTTPASAVSTRSSAPLLGRHHPGFSPSPQLSQSSWSQSPKPNRADRRWEEEYDGVSNALGLISKKKTKASMGSPVQSEILRTSFPPPPTR
ncbi:hypothetical protein Trco_001164 [Trichoderma cornu-damae]|uniref:LPXTG-domain-containing protein n=1 Tax=Trichoderma cornu-damae TaxID=654480 RepID=A0A9P8QTS2_9HYPO|nr:hypothetical protein Trco_001164 [Trichoderma cornu-damae]